jgi:tetratricopeptide (TPR) repeat protein
MRGVLIWVAGLLLSPALLAQGSVADTVKALAEAKAQNRPHASDLELKLLTLNQAINESPQNPELVLKKGIYLLELGRTQQAVDVFEGLRTSYPSHPAPHINLAAAYAQQGRLEEARQMLLKADGLQSGRHQTHLSLASVNIGLALASIRKAKELKPGDPLIERKAREIEQLLVKVNASPYASTDLADLAVTKPARPGQAVSVAAPAPKGDRLMLASPVRDTTEAVQPAKMDAPASSGNVADDERKAEALNVIESWASAWSQRKQADYLAHYSDRFRPPGGGDRDAWIQRKQLIIDKARFINVDVKVQQIRVNGAQAWVLVTQRYRSDLHADVTRKELKLGLEDGRWKILSERPQ